MLSYAALNEAEVSMYNQYPTFKSDKEREEFETLGYPKKYLPDLINEFGILVQKPYAGTYALDRQKDELAKYFNQERTNLTTAINAYRYTNPKNPNAYDAVAIKALNTFADNIDTLDRATSELTLDSVKTKSLGDYYNKFLSNDDFSIALSYSNIAKDYLLANIKHFNKTYEASLNEDSSKLDQNQTKKVRDLLPTILDTSNNN